MMQRRFDRYSRINSVGLIVHYGQYRGDTLKKGSITNDDFEDDFPALQIQR